MPSRSPLLARLAGDPLRAGDLYYQQGKLPQAAAMYRRARRFDQAARVYLEMGDRAGALALYLEGNDHLRAGELLAADGDHKTAVRHFETAESVRERYGSRFEELDVLSLPLPDAPRLSYHVFSGVRSGPGVTPRR